MWAYDPLYHPKLERLTITRDLHQWLKARFGVKPNTPEWRFLTLLCFGTFRDKQTNELVVPKQDAAYCKGFKNSYHYGFCFTSTRFFAEMQERFPELQISWSKEWRAIDGKARVLHYILPVDVTQQVDKELESIAPEYQRVYIETGHKITHAAKAQLLKQREAHNDGANQELYLTATDDARLIYDYLRQLPSHSFQKVLPNIEAAKAVIEDPATELTPQGKRMQYTLLEGIQQVPKPIYSLSERTTRITTRGHSIALLKSQVRKALTTNWIELDLKSAQLAINAKNWNVPELQEFLLKRESWWELLFDWYECQGSPAFKAELKKATYACCYGAGKDAIKKCITEKPEHFLNHPIVKALRKAGQAQLKSIKRNKGAFDAYGRWMTLRKEEKGECSILALVSQSWEQLLISEIFKLANTTNEFKVMLYQSDGVSVSFRDNTRKQYWLDKIVSVVDKKAKELEFITYLEVTYPL